MSRTLIALVGLSLLLGSGLPTHARGTTNIQGPGFKVQHSNGWFGTQQNVYSDALGNRLEQKNGLFGRRKTSGQVLGNRVERDNRGTTVTDNSGNVILKRRRGWFGSEDTTINTNGVFQRMKGVFTGGSNSTPAPYGATPYGSIPYSASPSGPGY